VNIQVSFHKCCPQESFCLFLHLLPISQDHLILLQCMPHYPQNPLLVKGLTLQLFLHHLPFISTQGREQEALLQLQFCFLQQAHLNKVLLDSEQFPDVDLGSLFNLFLWDWNNKFAFLWRSSWESLSSLCSKAFTSSRPEIHPIKSPESRYIHAYVHTQKGGGVRLSIFNF